MEGTLSVNHDGEMVNVLDLVGGVSQTTFTFTQTEESAFCHNPATYDLNGGRLASIEEILERIDRNPLLDGITISGGELFLQPGPCAVLSRESHKRGLSVVVYTGFTFEEILCCGDSDRLSLLKETDLLIDGPFIASQRSLNLKYQDSQGKFADFHGLCHTFITNLSLSGVDPKTAQTLARHSTMELTMNVYTHLTDKKQIEAINLLPSPQVNPPDKEKESQNTDKT